MLKNVAMVEFWQMKWVLEKL